jgi:uroporphyrinogen decarboxylase
VCSSDLDPRKELKEYVRAVSILSREVGRTMPILFTLPSPLVIAVNHVSTSERTYEDMRVQPDALKQGLETIAETCIDYGRACINEGATGVFYGLGGGGNIWSRMNCSQLEEYGLRYDKKVLEALRDAPIRLLHICSRKNQEDPQRNGGLMESGWFKQYPVNAINWWDATFTPLPVAKRVYGERFCIVGGIDQESAMRAGGPERVESQVKIAIENAGQGGGLIVGAGCTFFQDTPLENINAVGRAVEKYSRHISQK